MHAKGTGRQFHGERREHAFVAFNGMANSGQEICAYQAPSSARYKSTQEILSKIAACARVRSVDSIETICTAIRLPDAGAIACTYKEIATREKRMRVTTWHYRGGTSNLSVATDLASLTNELDANNRRVFIELCLLARRAFNVAKFKYRCTSQEYTASSFNDTIADSKPTSHW